MACYFGIKRENELGLCDFIEVVGVYWFSWFRGVVKWDSGLVLSIHEASIFCDANWKFRFRGHFN